MGDKQLYTWVDVQNRLRELQSIPEGQHRFRGKSLRAYWDGLHVSLTEATRSIDEPEIKVMLGEVFLARYDKEQNVIILGESPNTTKFPVLFESEEDYDDIPLEVFRAEFSQREYIARILPVEAKRYKSDRIPLSIAFHSFKGGVGRTLHAIALAISLGNEGKKVLVIDSDFEAPGISWYFTNPSISFADFIAMAHGDTTSDFSYTLGNAVTQIPKNHIDENIFILPAFRDPNQFGEPIIKPEHLNTDDEPFKLQDLVSLLGEKLKVDYIIIDLRAGLSELSSGWLLDPNVYKVIVTTLSGQSLRGCQNLIERTNLIYNKFGFDNNDNLIPFIIFSQVPTDFDSSVRRAWESDSDLFPNKDFENLKKTYIDLFKEDLDDSPFPKWEDSVCFSVEYSNLKNLPHSWDDVIKQIEFSEINERIEPLKKWIPIPDNTSLKTIENDKFFSLDDQLDNRLDEFRRKLSEVSRGFITADSNVIDDFLITQSIEQLANRHITSLPIVVIVGAKGSGKTYLFKSIGGFDDWSDFVKKVKNSPDSEIIRSSFCNVTSPENVTLKERNPFGITIKTHIQNELLKSNATTSQWRQKWLDIIAWSAGESVGVEGAWESYFSKINQKTIFLFDGLEEIFSEYYKNESHKTALRALLQDVPNWLESLSDKKLGLIIFIRQDIVSYVIPQNVTQFLTRYRDYQLKWNEEEALRLAYWICDKSEVLASSKRSPKGLKGLDRPELESALYSIWGQRLGSNSSREARTANWVLGALSNLQDEVQSRDIVRFLHFASEASISDSTKRFYSDRLLTPTSIKNSIAKVGAEKLDEVRQENTPLYEILQNIKNQSPEIKFPCPKVKLGFLEPYEREMLEKNGVLGEYKNEYYLAEIYRRGLGIGYSKIGKPRLI